MQSLKRQKKESPIALRQIDWQLPELVWTFQEPKSYNLVCRQLLYFPRFRMSAASSYFFLGGGGLQMLK